MPLEEKLALIPKKSFREYYTLGPHRGDGGFTITFEALRISDNKPLAVKVFKRKPTLADIEECFFMSKI